MIPARGCRSSHPHGTCAHGAADPHPRMLWTTLHKWTTLHRLSNTLSKPGSTTPTTRCCSPAAEALARRIWVSHEQAPTVIGRRGAGKTALLDAGKTALLDAGKTALLNAVEAAVCERGWLTVSVTANDINEGIYQADHALADALLGPRWAKTISHRPRRTATHCRR